MDSISYRYRNSNCVMSTMSDIDQERASMQRMLLLKRVASNERKVDADVVARIALDEIEYQQQRINEYQIREEISEQ